MKLTPGLRFWFLWGTPGLGLGCRKLPAGRSAEFQTAAQTDLDGKLCTVRDSWQLSSAARQLRLANTQTLAETFLH
jgi:hypothetical protein